MFKGGLRVGTARCCQMFLIVLLVMLPLKQVEAWTQQTAVILPVAAQASPGILAKISKAREYHRHYSEVRENYAALLHEFEGLRDEVASMEKQLALGTDSEAIFSILGDREQKAWRRIYEASNQGGDTVLDHRGRIPEGEEPPRTRRVPRPRPLTDFPLNPKFEGGWISKVVQGYEFYKARYEEIQTAHRILGETVVDLRSKRRDLQGRLNSPELRKSRNTWEREREAWRRIYHE